VLVKSIVRKTLGIKNHVVKKVEQDEEGVTIYLDVYKRRRLACGRCGTQELRT